MGQFNSFEGKINFLPFNNIEHRRDTVEHSSALLRKYCPAGTSQEENALIYPVDTPGYDLFRQYKDCNALLSNRDATNLQFVCTAYHFTHKVCCERCLKFKLNKCVQQPCMDVPTCESLKVNPCFNGGKCVTIVSLINSSTADTAFRCECPSNYKGIFGAFLLA